MMIYMMRARVCVAKNERSAHSFEQQLELLANVACYISKEASR